MIAGNAFFVVGEYAIVTARRGALRSRGGMGAASALRLMDDPVRVISTVQVGITAIGILTGAIGEPLVRDLLGDWSPAWLGFVIAFGIVTYLSVVFGELVPKALTLDRAETLVVLVAPPVELLTIVFRPVVLVLEAASSLVLRPFGVTDVVAGDGIRSPEELRAVVDEAEGAGVIETHQETLLHNVLDFAGRDVLDALVPAAEVDWLDADTPVEDALTTVIERPRSRYVVARGSLNHVVGIVHVRDLVAASRRSPAARVEEVAGPAHVVPATKGLKELLEELRAGRHQLAAIVDEYGGLLGIVTVEDIVEELVGEIYDEHDPREQAVERLEDGSLEVDGELPVDTVQRLAEVELGEPAARTIGGAVFEALGRRPDLGDEVTLGRARAAVAELDGVRIARVRVTPS